MIASSVIITTAAASPVVTTAEQKVHMRLLGDDGSHDALIAGCVAAATSLFERLTSRALVERTLQLGLDRFPSACTERDTAIYLPKPPAITVTELQYLDEAATWQTLEAAAYTADVAHQPARLVPVDAWPATTRQPGAVKVQYAAGYGAAAAVPADIRAAIKMLAAHFYEHPEASTQLTLSQVPMAVGTIIEQYRMPEVA